MKKRVLSALLALCLTLSLAGAAFAENETPVSSSSSAASESVAATEPESKAAAASDSTSGESKAESEPEEEPTSTETPAASDVTEEEQEETAASEVTPAPTEDPEAEVTEKAEADGSVEYTAALETDGQTMNVIVTAPDGAFAEGVEPQLSVTMLTAEDELNDVANKLTDAEVQYDGFAALDITFTDKATGEEIEPVQQVSVRIELPQAIVDSGIDLNTLAVQHLEEDENGDVQKVTEVATLDNGITLSEEAAAAANEAAGVAPMSDMPAEEATAGDAAETPAAVAEFDVDGFSGFVITWNGPGLHTDGKINVVYWNTEGNGSELAVPNQYLFNIGKLDNGDSITLQNGILTVNGREYEIPQQVTVGNDTYEYVGAKCHYDNRWQDFTKIWLEAGFGWNYKVDGGGSSSRPDIRLLYERVETTTPGGDQGGNVTNPASVTTMKTANIVDDQTKSYDLTLGVSGDQGTGTTNMQVDVLFIIDNSGSMDYSMVTGQDKWGRPTTDTRMHVVQDAMSTMVDTLNAKAVASKGAIDIEYAAVKFSDADGTQSISDWTSNVSNFKSIISNDNILNANGGTNWQAGIYEGNNLLKEHDTGIRANATRIVIFLSDGVPTFAGRGTQSNPEKGTGYQPDQQNVPWGSEQSWNDIADFARSAATEAGYFDCNYFYTIGVGNDFVDENSYAYTNMSTVKNGVTVRDGGNSNIFAANDPESLQSAFTDIVAQSFFFSAQNVQMEDELSDWAEFDPQGENGAIEFTVKIEKKNEDGTSYTKVAETIVNAGIAAVLTTNEAEPITVKINPEVSNKAITVKLTKEDGSDYSLEPGYRYSVTTRIKPSQTAIDAGMDSEYAEQTPDFGTGTHADNGENGFWSNVQDDPTTTEVYEGAKVTYTANGEPGYTPFDRPVIQVPEIKTGNLIIKKTVVGLDEETLNTLKDTLTFELSPSVGETSSVKLSNFTKDEANSNSATKTFAYTYTFADVPTGSYTITETYYTVDKYDCTTDPADQVKSVTVAGNSDTEAAFTNTYTRQTGTLVLDKAINGIDDADQKAVQNLIFNFTITGPKDAVGVVVDGTDSENVVAFELDGDVAKANVQVTVGADVAISNLPTGTYTVTETVPNESVTTSNYEIVNGKYYFASATGNGTVVQEVEKGTSKTAQIVNNYEPYKSLRLTKNIQGTGAVDAEQFTFLITGSKSMTLTTKDGSTVHRTDGTFTMKGGETFTIGKLKDADEITITETDSKGYDVTLDLSLVAGYDENAETEQDKHRGFTLSNTNSVIVDVDSVTGVGADNSLGEIVYINKKNIPTPTGLEGNHTKPFGLMISVAVLAGMALVGGVVVRRRRRWME